eukprot:TRINITY_DN107237_c0_g1_i1.p1 TRINITY_DN107237_c0_g1~~TRINITY_DN107237_c0_g1_i1.p1  ORF type:complete len:197 (-),score=16.08 TRINITY_DN107237_c0_g1_i1:367-957(-)
MEAKTGETHDVGQMMAAVPTPMNRPVLAPSLASMYTSTVRAAGICVSPSRGARELGRLISGRRHNKHSGGERLRPTEHPKALALVAVPSSGQRRSAEEAPEVLRARRRAMLRPVNGTHSNLPVDSHVDVVRAPTHAAQRENLISKQVDRSVEDDGRKKAQVLRHRVIGKQSSAAFPIPAPAPESAGECSPAKKRRR